MSRMSLGGGRRMVGGNLLSGTLGGELGNLSVMQNLMLAVNSLSGAVPSHLSSLTSLEYIEIGAFIHNDSLCWTISCF